MNIVHFKIASKDRYKYFLKNKEHLCFQGKGLMDTYWLTCKEGVQLADADADAVEGQASLLDETYDSQPAFLRRIRGMRGERYI